MHHQLERLGPSGFQDLAQALAIKTCSAQVQALGSGRDGGRDMVFNGILTWPREGDTPGQVWDGTTVFQVKHKERVSDRPETNASWLWGHVRGELEKWADPASKRGQVPNYLVIVTNVPLTPTPESGGLAVLNANIQKFINDLDDASRDVGSGSERKAKQASMSRLRDWLIWDGNQVDKMLLAYPDIRRAFPSFLTAADVLANLAQFTDKLPLDELKPGLTKHARASLVSDGMVFFDEAGSTTSPGARIEDVAIDLPVTLEANENQERVFKYVLERGERVLKPRLGLHPRKRHIVLAGGPGNGKTTVSKFLVHIYRAAFFEGSAEPGTQQAEIIAKTRQTLARLKCTMPMNRRWPIRIDLPEYVAEGGLSEDSTMLRWISKKVSDRLDSGTVMPRALDSWMKQWPWFVVLDGLDEVTEPSVRKRLIEQVSTFVAEAETDQCDLFVVITTRPVGYVEDIAPEHFERIDLAELSPDDALAYGTLAAKLRLRDDTERIARVVKSLAAAAASEALQNLLKTPLQVLIMSIIVESSPRLDPDRFRLFWGYFETVLRRESNKTSPTAALIRDNAQHILALHQKVGFELQVRSELAEGSSATLSINELRNIGWQVLDRAGFSPSGADSEFLDKIVQAATHRLVLLSAKGSDGLGFDVRSLQELMAASHITTGPFDEVAKNLSSIAASPHWRNTWLFAAGRIFAEPQPHQQKNLVELVRHIDQSAFGRLGDICPVGPTLALDIVDDGMVLQHPGHMDLLLTHGLRILDGPAPLDSLPYARALVRAASSGERAQKIIVDAIRNALNGLEMSRLTAEAIQGRTKGAVTDIRARKAADSLRGIRSSNQSGNTQNLPELAEAWSSFGETIDCFIPENGGPELDLARGAIHRARNSQTQDGDAETVTKALEDPERAEILEAALQYVTTDVPTVAWLRDKVIPIIHRAAVGSGIQERSSAL